MAEQHAQDLARLNSLEGRVAHIDTTQAHQGNLLAGLISSTENITAQIDRILSVVNKPAPPPQPTNWVGIGSLMAAWALVFGAIVNLRIGQLEPTLKEALRIAEAAVQQHTEDRLLIGSYVAINTTDIGWIKKVIDEQEARITRNEARIYERDDAATLSRRAIGDYAKETRQLLNELKSQTPK